MIYQSITDLIEYAVECGLIESCDRIWAENRILSALKLSDWDKPATAQKRPLEGILKEILDWACEQGIIEDDITSRDLFDTELMAALTPRPSEVQRIFNEKYAVDPKEATDWFYHFSQAVH